MIIQNKDNILQSGFICTSGNSSSGVQISLSIAITITYNMIFKTKTTFSGSAVIGLDQINIILQLLEDIYFVSIFLNLEPILIVISHIGDDIFNGTDLEFHYKDENALDIWKKTKLLQNMMK
ncbi:3721_t:CDS:2 [Cetraspora pellucida]|uniref:3721_t:CDS:1 n=1 Tax=Cetraspora pellucida TaxID=1433469 RepID=A0A9N9BWV3_9GLOM|nr:3721_t:CDS:2 [Cetraspora pellucida]